jgi:ribonucleoside-triphosphate reductase
MDQYQEFIAKSRYARHLPAEGRREDWFETVSRWREFMETRFGTIGHDDQLWNAVEVQIRNMRVFPSMRSLMTAGPALARSEECIYNCAYTTADLPDVFWETMWLSLNGCGVGFSVERQYVDKLPTVKYFDPLVPTVKIVVEDSKEGWCAALKKLIQALWLGYDAEWDVSKVRPKGAPLKTMGGRASGPEPLVSLFEYTVKMFESSRGKQLRPIQVHDILCKIAESVVVGGVRRSAMISLGDLDDAEHRDAKKGDWWETHPERQLANNSAVFQGEESWERFKEEWTALQNSGSGERGIFNRKASRNQAQKTGRSSTIQYGTNPCSEIILRPQQFCNLSTIIANAKDTIHTLMDKIFYATFVGTIQSSFTRFNKDFMRPAWELNAKEEPLLGVSITGIYDCPLIRQIGDPDRALEQLREYSEEINKLIAKMIGIKASPARTCIKPEGTTTQLSNAKGAGVHPSYDDFYIRRVRNDKKDPLSQFMIACGVPYEDDRGNEGSYVFSFPKTAKGSVTRNQVSTIEHLELWLTYQRAFCDHKPSVTIYVKEGEWDMVRDWLWKHFDEITGCAFLPYDGGTYQQAPYEKIDEETYNKLVSEMPVLDWRSFKEEEDNFTSSPECSAGVCTI